MRTFSLDIGQVGASKVLRVLLSAAFGISLKDLAPLNEQMSRSELLTRAASFSDLCSSFVYPNGGEAKQGDAGDCMGYPLRAVLFDILHSVVSEQLIPYISLAH